MISENKASEILEKSANKLKRNSDPAVPSNWLVGEDWKDKLCILEKSQN